MKKIMATLEFDTTLSKETQAMRKEMANFEKK